MASNFIGQAAPLGQAIDPEMQALQRQKQMAAALMNQMGQQPQGQMVSGHYVPASWTQNLAALVNPMVGSYMATEADKRAIELQNAQDRAAQANIFAARKVMQGMPERTVYGAGEEGPTKKVEPAKAGDRETALAMLLRPNRSALETTMAGKILEQDWKEPKWEKDTRYNERGQEIHGWTNVNDPSLPFRAGTAKPLLSTKDIIDLQWEGKPIPKGAMGGGTGYVNENTLYGNQPTGGAPMGGMPAAGGQMGGAPMGAAPMAGGQQISVSSSDKKYLPKDIPQYEYDPDLSQKDNMAARADFNKGIQTSIKNAKDSVGTIKSAVDILNTGAPSSGGLQNLATYGAETLGYGTKASGADAQLKILGTKLTMQQPRFEGPQSNADSALYQAAAGEIGNANKPISTRLAALDTMIKLNKKYYPNGDWDSIDLFGPVKVKNIFGGTRGLGAKTLTPNQFAMGLKDEKDKAAFEWLKKNPFDPRAEEVRNQLGIE
jgi:hypothetical protein